MTETTPDAIKVHSLAKTFKTQTASLCLFKDLSLTVKQGESVAIIGQSGAGKSTLLSLLAGLDHPSSGSVQLLGQDIHTLDDEARARWRATHLSFIFQSFHLLPELTAQENVQLALDIRGDRDTAKQARALLTQVGLGERLQHYPSELSGGEQQRVAIARAFVTAPRLLFADEPTGNLDTQTAAQIIQQLFTMNAQHNTTLILITHDTALATRCSRQLQLTHGQLIEMNTNKAT